MNEQPLSVVQRWMQSVIMHPAGVQAGLASDLDKRQIDIAPDDVDKIINRSRSQTSVERLSIYAKAYFARLIECLAGEFPIFCQTVGGDAFAEFAVDYLKHFPSQSYTLAKLGEKFPRYLWENRPPQTNDERQCGWADFLVDLARLERTFGEVFDSVGIEGRPVISAESLLGLPTERWPNVRLQTVPCLRLLELAFPLDAFYTAAKRGERPAIPHPAESWIAVTRRDYIVRRYELTRPQFALLNAVRGGQTLGEAIEAAVRLYPGSITELAVELREWFRVWTTAPMFASLLEAE